MGKFTEPEVELDVVLEPEIVQQLATYRQQVVRLQDESKAIQIVDEAGEGAALIFITGVKQIEKDLENYRDGLVRPHNGYVKTVNKSVKEIAGLADALVSAMDARRSEFLLEKERRIAAANRLAAAEAERIRLEKEAKEKALREEAERLQKEAERLERERIEREIKAEMEKAEAERKRKEAEAAIEAARLKAIADKAAAEQAVFEGNRKEAEKLKRQAEESQRAEELARTLANQVQADGEAWLRLEEAKKQASVAEQARLEKAAIKAEAKADIVAEQAATVAPTIQFNDSMGTRVLDNGAKVGTRLHVDWMFARGLSKDESYYRDDPRVKDLPDSLFKLDQSLIGRQVRAGASIPGVTAIKTNRTVSSR